MASVNAAHLNAVVEAIGFAFDRGTLTIHTTGSSSINFELGDPAFARVGTGRIQALGLPREVVVSLDPGDTVDGASLLSHDNQFQIMGLRVGTPEGPYPPGLEPHVLIDRLPLEDGETVRLLSLTYQRSGMITRTPGPVFSII